MKQAKSEKRKSNSIKDKRQSKKTLKKEIKHRKKIVAMKHGKQKQKYYQMNTQIQQRFKLESKNPNKRWNHKRS